MVYSLASFEVPESRTTHKQRWQVRGVRHGEVLVCGTYRDKEDAVLELQRRASPFFGMLDFLSTRETADRDGDLCRVQVIGRNSGIVLWTFEILEVTETC